MLARLGPKVWHDLPPAAIAAREQLEETARRVCLGPTVPQPPTAPQIDELRHTFGAR